jgi:hypothetical protein
MRNPYEEAFENYPTMRRLQSRHYVKPERYNAAQDINQTARTVVQGAVVIGALGLLGGLMNR